MAQSEDAASGAQLIQTLLASGTLGVPAPIARTPEGDKTSRVAGVSAMIEAEQLILPAQEPWLADFKSELLAFPTARFDDQVDALSQLLLRVRRNDGGQIWESCDEGWKPSFIDWNDDIDPWY